MPAQWIALAVATLAAAMGLSLLSGLDGCSQPSARATQASACFSAPAQWVAQALRV